jgi:hypothetical protein
MQWFRMHTEARTDRKLDTLTDAEHRVWFGLLCMAGEGPERGTVAFESLDLLALEVAKGDGELLGHTMSRLVTLRIVTARDNEIEFLNWDKRQYDKPSDTPEATRRRKAEERHRKAKSDDVTPSHTTSRPITDTDTENTQNRTDTEEPPLIPPVGEKPSPKRKTQIPVSWIPDQAGREYAIGRGVPPDLVDDQVQRFKNFHAGKGNLFADVPHAWRTWADNYQSMNRGNVTPMNRGPGSGPYGRMTPADHVAAARESEERDRRQSIGAQT